MGDLGMGRITKTSTTVRVLGWGRNQGRAGDCRFDARAGRAILADFRRRGGRLRVDFYHQNLLSDEGPWAGTVRALRVVSPSKAGRRQPGLYATIAWAPRAAVGIARGELGQVEPVLKVRGCDRRVVGLHAVGLVA